MTVNGSYLIAICLYSFVCFQVTADLNLGRNDNRRFESKDKRSAYQTPVLSSPSLSLTEDYSDDVNWPSKNSIQIGQVGGVSLTLAGEVVVFHRGDRVWGSSTFNWNNQYTEKNRGPISSPTVVVIHPDTGALLHQWGENMFYLPHGVTVDREDNLWLTDVALHQVFKFPPLAKNERAPLLAIGEPFVPGNSAVRFCKPTSVAITPEGDFFVADGYCNSRLIKFNKAGVKIMEIGHASFRLGGLGVPDPYAFYVPHALTLAEDRKLVCVADRENGRVLCYRWDNGTFSFQIESPQIGSLIYSVAYSPREGGLFFLVNGEERKLGAVPVRGFVVSASNLRLLSYFGGNLKTPHDLAVSADAKHVYVGEIGPNIVHKYSKISDGSVGVAASTTVVPKSAQSVPEVIAPISPQPLSLSGPQGTVLPAVLVTSAAILFGAAIVTAALVYSRARRRGCGHCSGRRWMLGRSPAEGFMIGHLLGQHQGFEKLSTGEESEEEVTSLQPFA